ncbi:hypothetical protein E2C01_056514 [Portunus trituberculatus]|uniref:Uncharacterized protein n=1 Tax=Portunus trituberculatus TaxID=210409 RepID=A0A5B7GXW5_PORTR|nr:hypothetical protein [Portunus trituberculatus]
MVVPSHSLDTALWCASEATDCQPQRRVEEFTSTNRKRRVSDSTQVMEKLPEPHLRGTEAQKQQHKQKQIEVEQNAYLVEASTGGQQSLSVTPRQRHNHRAPTAIDPSAPAKWCQPPPSATMLETTGAGTHRRQSGRKL